MKKFKIPSAPTFLLLICAFVALLTWLIPAGAYQTITYDTTQKLIIHKNLEISTNLKATQETLDSLLISIPLEKFTSGAIWKPITIPNSYQKLTSKPQGIISFFQAPIKGIVAASDIIFLVLIIGGLIAIMNKTGAFDAGIFWLGEKLKGKEYLLIIVTTTTIALGGTTFGLAEETIAFYPILIPIFLAAKYDAIVALASVYIGSSVGTMFSTTNPFSTIIASDAAGINWTTGIEQRMIFLVISLAICILYIIRYAKMVQNNPSKSLIFGQKKAIETRFKKTKKIKLTVQLKIILFVFINCFVLMIYGVSQLNWWFLEMTTVFFVGAILIGIIGGIREKTFVNTFILGASDLLGVAIIIGIARGISILMDDGMISNTVLYYTSELTSGMNKGLFANLLVVIYGGLSFFIPSSSGMAVLTIPVIAPLADTIGFGREIIVNCYLYGMGLFSFINPTGLILATLAIVNVSFDKWLRFVLPLVGILFILVILITSFSIVF
ncbi:YfcC family protein [Flavicella sp.]|uniref:YfcC family protein n=1 Tax=Flavicella sp. TaxID=2957742 RepID=UPI003017EB1B